MKSAQSFLREVFRLPFEVYLTLYVRVVLLASKKNSRAVAQGASAGFTTVLQVILILGITDYLRGTVEFLGKIGVLAVYLVLFGINYLVLRTMRRADAFETEFASMSATKRRFLDILAVGWIIFVVGFFFLTLPPLPPGAS